eukprot:TRINITY_DN6599_c0_g1_i2.p1 TRINITY_DN6599_c0_g1~~TRINITY_DN6599_c0_g1_i2.p1  ORF type:complete len:1001 (+),score=146.94 TRINITY_DN6599_c0_g1_i2:27-3029(+)
MSEIDWLEWLSVTVTKLDLFETVREVNLPEQKYAIQRARESLADLLNVMSRSTLQPLGKKPDKKRKRLSAAVVRKRSVSQGKDSEVKLIMEELKRLKEENMNLKAELRKLKPSIPRLETADSIRDIFSKRRHQKLLETKPEAAPAILEGKLELSLPPLIKSCDIFRLHDSNHTDIPETVRCIYIPQVYKQKFFGKVHLNFLGYDAEEKEFLISCVNKNVSSGVLQAVTITKTGYQEYSIPTSIILDSEKDYSFADLMTAHFSSVRPGTVYQYIPEAKFSEEILRFEELHPQNHKTLKVAVLHSKGKEKTFQDIFMNPGSTKFWSFLTLIGDRIEMKDWKGFRGEYGQDEVQFTYYTKWDDIEVMYHPAPILDEEQQRRIIGNDFLTLIYHESPEPFDPDILAEFGNMAQVFHVVQKVGRRYRIGTFTRLSQKTDYLPYIGPSVAWSSRSMKEVLLTKMFNGYNMILRTPPFNRLFEIPRKAELDKLGQNFLSQKLSKKKTYGLTLGTKPTTKSSNNILVTVVSAKNLLGRTHGWSDPFCSVTIFEQEQKTQTKTKTLNPDWNETLVFSCVGVNPLYHFVTVRVKHWTMVGSQSLGMVDISFTEISKFLGKEKEFVLGYDTRKESDASGSITLKFELSGPGAEECPICGLFTGEMDTVAYINAKYHASCVKCCVCRRSLVTQGEGVDDCYVCLLGSPDLNTAELFYCRTHYEAASDTLNDIVPVLPIYNKGITSKLEELEKKSRRRTSTGRRRPLSERPNYSLNLPKSINPSSGSKSGTRYFDRTERAADTRLVQSQSTSPQTRVRSGSQTNSSRGLESRFEPRDSHDSRDSRHSRNSRNSRNSRESRNLGTHSRAGSGGRDGKLLHSFSSERGDSSETTPSASPRPQFVKAGPRLLERNEVGPSESSDAVYGLGGRNVLDHEGPGSPGRLASSESPILPRIRTSRDRTRSPSAPSVGSYKAINFGLSVSEKLPKSRYRKSSSDEKSEKSDRSERSGSEKK